MTKLGRVRKESSQRWLYRRLLLTTAPSATPIATPSAAPMAMLPLATPIAVPIPMPIATHVAMIAPLKVWPLFDMRSISVLEDLEGSLIRALGVDTGCAP